MAVMPHPMSMPAKLVKTPPAFHCIACGQEDGATLELRANPLSRPFELHRCNGCGLVQQFPRWNSAKIAALYDKNYYVFAESEENRWARAVQQYAVHLAPHESRSGQRLLDVGCAMGHLSALARARGWRVTGIDISADAVSQAAVRFGLDVRAGSLAAHAGTLLPFDVVLLGDVLEHVIDPARLLEDVRKILAPGGCVCIDTPNWGGFWRRWGGSRWLGLNRYHINLFDAQSLSRLLTACGFQDITAGSYTHYRYEGWASRPELRGWIDKLPRFIGWRITRFLERRKPNTRWSPLRDIAMKTLEDAGRVVNEMASATPAISASDSADNLIATARR